MRLSFPSGEILSSSYTPFTLKHWAVGVKDKIRLKGKGCSQVRVSFQLTQRGRVRSEEVRIGGFVFHGLCLLGQLGSQFHERRVGQEK